MSCCSLLSQTNNDPVYFNFSYFPSQDMTEAEAKAALKIAEASVVLPKLFSNEKLEIYTQIGYKYSHYTIETLLPDKNNFGLNDIRTGFIFRYFLSENYEIIVLPRINIRSDFKSKLDKDDFFPSFNAITLKKSTAISNLTYGLGITYNNDLNKNVILPLGYLKYQTEKFRVYAILPSFAHLSLTPKETFEYGLSYHFDAAIFHADSLSDTDAVYLKTLNVTVAPTISYNITNNFWLNAKAGASLFRNYHFLDKDFDNLSITEKNNLKESFFATIGLSLRME